MVKPLFIISADGAPIHRLLAGLPTVRHVTMADDDRLQDDLREFVQRIPRAAVAYR